MSKNIEVELRGLLSKEKLLKLEKIFQKTGKFKEKRERIIIDYSTFLPNQGVKGRNLDIRLRATNGLPEIMVKIGKWGGAENRKEISAVFGRGEFDKLVQIFGALGLKKGMLCVRQSRLYDYSGIEFALVEVPNHSYYFEAEKMVSKKEEILQANAEIELICQQLGLKIFNDCEFFNYIEKLNREANEVFDFENYQENFFKDKFGI